MVVLQVMQCQKCVHVSATTIACLPHLLFLLCMDGCLKSEVCETRAMLFCNIINRNFSQRVRVFKRPLRARVD